MGTFWTIPEGQRTSRRSDPVGRPEAELHREGVLGAAEPGAPDLPDLPPAAGGKGSPGPRGPSGPGLRPRGRRGASGPRSAGRSEEPVRAGPVRDEDIEVAVAVEVAPRARPCGPPSPSRASPGPGGTSPPFVLQQVAPPRFLFSEDHQEIEETIAIVVRPARGEAVDSHPSGLVGLEGSSSPVSEGAGFSPRRFAMKRSGIPSPSKSPRQQPLLSAQEARWNRSFSGTSANVSLPMPRKSRVVALADSQEKVIASHRRRRSPQAPNWQGEAPHGTASGANFPSPSFRRIRAGRPGQTAKRSGRPSRSGSTQVSAVSPSSSRRRAAAVASVKLHPPRSGGACSRRRGWRWPGPGRRRRRSPPGGAEGVPGSPKRPPGDIRRTTRPRRSGGAGWGRSRPGTGRMSPSPS